MNSLQNMPEIFPENFFSLLLHKNITKESIAILAEKITHFSKADLTAFYINKSLKTSARDYKLLIKIGSFEIPKILSGKSDAVDFLKESREVVFLTERKSSYFRDILLNEDMFCGFALPVFNENILYGIMIVNFLDKTFLNSASVSNLERCNHAVSNIFKSLKMNYEY